MRLITRLDIQRWGKEIVGASTRIPIVMYDLVRAITPPSTLIDFPGLTLANVPGWDGTVRCEADCGNVPQGISLWEFSVEKGVTGKADREYAKRTKNPLGYDRSQCTFIFVTTEFWLDRDKWVKEKKAEGIWKDVRVYNSHTLEQWVESVLPVSRWFADQLNKVPTDGTATAEEFWKGWAQKEGLTLTPEVVTAGRKAEQQKLIDFLSKPKTLIGIQASTRQESIAFVVASLKAIDDSHDERLSSRVLIVSDVARFRMIANNNKFTSLILIADFNDWDGIQVATMAGHNVIVPMGTDDESTFETFPLPIVDRDGQVAALMVSGLSRDDSERFSRESGRNVTVLRRLLEFPGNHSSWSSQGAIRDMIPALLLGRWASQKPGDRSLIEFLSGKSYNEYERILFGWRNMAGSPVMQIGETWRLVSPLDAWASLGRHLTPKDLEMLNEAFTMAFAHGNPEQPKTFDFETPKKSFSDWVRDGIVQSLILIGLYGDKFRIQTPTAGQAWVDDIVSELLDGADGAMWISLTNQLPLLAEASPERFTASIRLSLAETGKPIMEMFVESPGLIVAHSSHSRLLFALEACAWLPEMLIDATECLAHLAQLDPGGTLSNRPINSLQSIYTPWYHQTLADSQGRKDGIDAVIAVDPETGWRFLQGLLMSYQRGIAEPTHQFRWRMIGFETRHKEVPAEVHEIEQHVVLRTISLFDKSDAKAAELIEKIMSFDEEQRQSLRKLIESASDNIKASTELLTWNALRRFLSIHRSHSESDETISAEELADYDHLYRLLAPVDIMAQSMWLFQERWVQLPEGREFEQSYEQMMTDRRIEATRSMVSEVGLEKVLQFAGEIKEPLVLGDSLAFVVNDEGGTLRIAELLKGGANQQSLTRGYFHRRSFNSEPGWPTVFFDSLKAKGFDAQALAHFLTAIPFWRDMWKLLTPETEEAYWKKVYPAFPASTGAEKDFAILKLVEFKRAGAGFTFASLYSEDLQSATLLAVLNALQGDDAEPVSESAVRHIFTELDRRSDVDRGQLIRMEFKYLGILARYGSIRTPQLLHNELTANPKFFVEVLQATYRPKDDDRMGVELQDENIQSVAARAQQCWKLLNSWAGIPGVVNGKIDKDVLGAWVEGARTLAKEIDRLGPADAVIGKMLAKFPENPDYWPPVEIADLLEQYKSDRMKKEFEVQVINNHGSSSRGVFDGGKIERNLAAYCKRMALAHRKHPVVAKILTNVAASFSHRGKDEDYAAERDRLDY